MWVGYQTRQRIQENRSGHISILSLRNVKDDLSVDWASLIRTNQLSTREPHFLKTGEVVFCGRGFRIFAVPICDPSEKVVAASHFFVITPDSTQIDYRYLAWYMNSSSAQKYFHLNAHGTRMPNVRRRVLEQLPIPLPNLKYQNTIVSLNEAIQTEKKLTATLIEKRQSLIEAIVETPREENE